MQRHPLGERHIGRREIRARINEFGHRVLLGDDRHPLPERRHELRRPTRMIGMVVAVYDRPQPGARCN